MLFRKNYIFTLLFLFACESIGFSQTTHINFFHLNRNDGLSNNQVSSIIKDRSGYMWFGTMDGLNRYDGYQFHKYYTSEDTNSISGNTINDLYIDLEGVLWIGLANNGISRYNSINNSFTRFDMVQEKWLYEANNITGFAETGDSALWAGTDIGLYRFNRTKDVFELFDPETGQLCESMSDEYQVSQVQALCSDDKGGLWMAGVDRKLTYYNPVLDQYKEYDAMLPGSFNRALISSMIYTNDKLWIGGLGIGFSVFDPETAKAEELLPDFNIVVINDIKPNSEGNLMIASGNGFIIYNPVNGKYQQYYQSENDSRSLSSTATLSVFEDNEMDLYWVSAFSSGLNYAFRDKPFNHIEFNPQQFFNLSYREVTAIANDLKGNIWLAYSNGQIELHDVYRKMKIVVPIKSPLHGGSVGSVFKILAAPDGSIYCASWQGGIQKLNRSKMQFQPLFGSAEKYQRLIQAVDFRDVEIDGKGRIWATAHGKGVYIIDEKKENIQILKYLEEDEGLSNDWVFQISLEGDSIAWITSAYGLNRISMDDFEIEQFVSTSEPNSLLNSNIYYSTIDSQNNLWLACEQGLNLYNRSTNSFFCFSEENGLLLDMISCIIYCQDSSYWCSTKEGIINFKLKWKDDNSAPVLYDVRNFDQHDGLQSDFYSTGCGILDGDGTLFFGGRDGVDYFNPVDIRSRYKEPAILVNSISIFGETIYPGSKDGPRINSLGEIELDYRDRLIEIEYIALNYFKNKENIYSYKLEPLQQEYVNTGINRSLLFSSLAPGHYNLSVKVLLGNNQEYEATDVLKIYIKAPFWKKDWFYVIFVLIVILFIITIINWYTANLRNKKIQLERVVQNRTRELTNKNNELEAQAKILNETNLLLQESKTRIANQAEELRAQSEQLEVTNKDLRIANSTKDKFFSIVAHDLKNPFNTIMGFVELLQTKFDTQTDEEKKTFLGYLHESISTAYKLLENLLHWSRTQSGHLRVEIQNLPVGPLVRTNVRIIEPRIIQKNLQIVTDFEEGLHVKADSELINTVIRNLLSNAVKYTKSGGKVGIRVFRSSHGIIHFEVSDTGHGMSKEELSKVLRIDAHMQKQGTEGESGTGLGILLCKEFVEKMNGVFVLESEQGKGTTAIFTLPAV